MRTNIYAVEIVTETGPVISRYFETLKAARKWADWTSKTWPTRIMLGGPGGIEVA